MSNKKILILILFFSLTIKAVEHAGTQVEIPAARKDGVEIVVSKEREKVAPSPTLQVGDNVIIPAQSLLQVQKITDKYGQSFYVSKVEKLEEGVFQTSAGHWLSTKEHLKIVQTTQDTKGNEITAGDYVKAKLKGDWTTSPYKIIAITTEGDLLVKYSRDQLRLVQKGTYTYDPSLTKQKEKEKDFICNGTGCGRKLLYFSIFGSPP